MLTLRGTSKAKPIAITRSRNRRFDGEILYYEPDIGRPIPAAERAKLKAEDILNQLGHGVFKKGRTGRAVRKRDQQLLCESLARRDESPPVFDANDRERDHILRLLWKMGKKKLMRAETGKDFKLSFASGDGCFVPAAPRLLTSREKRDGITSRHTYLVCGPQGSGKSQFCADVAEEMLEQEPRKVIYLFSQCSEDRALDKLKPIRQPLDEKLVEQPIEPEEVADSICIFDDIEAVTDKNVQRAIFNLRDKLLVNGRKNNINVLCTTHMATNYGETRKPLNECDFIVLFPGAGAKAQAIRCLTTYGGMDKEQVKRVMDAGQTSRWICFSKSAPQYVLTQNQCWLL